MIKKYHKTKSLYIYVSLTQHRKHDKECRDSGQ